MKRGTPEHPKTRMLAEKLGAPKYATCGILELLWHLTARYAPRGDIGRFSDAMIADHLDWKGAPDQLVAALVDSGWLERDVKHRLIVHDWKDHCDQTVKRWVTRNKGEFIQKTVTSNNYPSLDTKNGVTSKNYPLLDTKIGKTNAKADIIGVVEPLLDTKEGVTSNNYPLLEKTSLPKPLPLPLPQPCVDSHAEAEGDGDQTPDIGHQTTDRIHAVTGAATEPDTGGGAETGSRTDGTDLTDLEEDARRAVEGDEAHRILMERPELRNLRYEQDLAARKDWACYEPRPNWVEIARWVSVKAVLAGHVNEPGSWLLAQYRKWFDDFQKKNGAIGAQRSTNPLVRLFRRER